MLDLSDLSLVGAASPINGLLLPHTPDPLQLFVVVEAEENAEPKGLDG